VRAAIAITVIALMACQTPSASSVSDGSLPTTQQCKTACEALKAATCSIGGESDCPTFLMGYSVDHDHRNPTTGKVFSCADVTSSTVKTVADAQRMGFVCAP
jgi:hypothetical protein